MNLRLLLLGLALALTCDGAEPARISIPDLLNPATRMPELRRYLLATEPPQAARNWANAVTFAEQHSHVRIEALHAPAKPPRYAVLWNWPVRENWSDELTRAIGQSPVLLPQDEVSVIVFSADGVPLSPIQTLPYDSIVADLKGDGELQVIEEHLGLSESTDYFFVYPLRRPAEVSLALVFNAHPSKRARQFLEHPGEAAGEEWRVRDSTRTGAGPWASSRR